MIRKTLFTICLALVAIVANAQTITDELRNAQNGQGKVTINQSSEIERLVNNVSTNTTVQAGKNTPKAAQSTVKEQNPDKTTDKETADNSTTLDSEDKSASDNAEKGRMERKLKSQSTVAAEGENVSVSTSKKIMRHSYKTTGYRIQVYSGGNKREDRQKCEEISAKLKAKFPNLPIYVHFYSPSWKCRAGNYTNQSEAQAMLKQIRAMGFSQACLVKGSISVQY